MNDLGCLLDLVSQGQLAPTKTQKKHNHRVHKRYSSNVDVRLGRIEIYLRFLHCVLSHGENVNTR